MKKQKLDLSKIKSVLSKDQMKKILAGGSGMGVCTAHCGGGETITCYGVTGNCSAQDYFGCGGVDSSGHSYFISCNW